MMWKPVGVVQYNLFLTSLELFNSLTPWKLPSAPGVQMHFLPPPLVSLHSASCAETDFSQPFLDCSAIPSLSVIGCPLESKYGLGMVICGCSGINYL